MTAPNENDSANRSGFSDDEQRRLRLAHRAIYLFPTFAGLLTISVLIIAEGSGLFGSVDNFPMIALLVNAFLAGIASAYTVARLHAVERGKWWRAGASFLLAFPMTFAATVLFGMLAGCSGLIR